MSSLKNGERLKAFKLLNLILDNNLLEEHRDELIEILDDTDNKIVADRLRPILPRWWPEKKKNVNLTHKRKDKHGKLVVEILLDALENDEDNAISQVLLKGKPRIGKTTTVICFASENEKKYKHIMCINCGVGKTRQELESLANHLKIESSELTIGQLAQKCFNKLSGKCLLIFEDVDEHSNIQELLPKTINFHTIVTSRKSIWGTENEYGRIKSYELKEFEEEETLEFLQPILTKYQIEFSEHQLKEIHRQLDGHPSALQRLIKAPALLDRKTSIVECTKRKQLMNMGILSSNTMVERHKESSSIPSQSSTTLMHLPELWGLPPRNPHFVGRKDLLRKLEEHFNNGGQSLILSTYHGLGGVGKTQTALEFAWQHYEEYKGVVWVNAESKDRLIGDYIQLRHTLRKSPDNEDMSNEEKAMHIKNWLEDPAQEGWLIIYDNAEKYGGKNGINKYIPVKGGKVLITSRYSEGWPQGFSIKVFTREESKTFIGEVLLVDASEEDKESLAETLGDLPLALAQACAYINKNRKISICRYLQIYEGRKEQLLKDKTLSESYGTVAADSNKAMVYITWDITVEAIREESLMAANWLNCCAYLASDHIPDFLIETFEENQECNPNMEIYEVALGILTCYSMLSVDEDQKSASIHRLLQQVIRLKEEKKEPNERWKSICLTGKVLLVSFPHGDNTNTGRAKINEIMPHLEVCLRYLQMWLSYLSPEFVKQAELDMSLFLTSITHGYNRTGEYVKERDLLEQVLAIEEKYYGPDNVKVTVTLRQLGNAYGSLGEAQKQRDLLQRALAIQEKYYSPDHIKLAATLGSLGNAYGSLGDAEKQRDLLQRALAIQEKHCGPDDIQVAVTLGCLGIAYGLLGDAVKKRDLLEKVLAINEKYYGPDHVEVAITLTNLGMAYESLGDTEKTRDMLEQALAINEKYYGPDHIAVAITLGNLGTVYGSLGDTHKKRDLLQRALAIVEKYYGPHHIKVTVTLGSLGHAYGALGYPDKQRDLLLRALSIEEKYYGPDHVEVAGTLKILGNAYGSLGDAGKNRDLLQRALAIQEKYYGPDHIKVAATLGNLGNAYGSFGDAEKQRDMHERALAIKEKYYGPGHIEVAVSLKHLGNAYGSLGDAEKQRDLVQRALAIEEKYYGPDHVKVADTLGYLGIAYGSLGDAEKQRNILQRALAIKEKYFGPDNVEITNTLTILGIAYGFLGDVVQKRDLLERALQIQEKYYGSDNVLVAVTLVNLGMAYGSLGDAEKNCTMLERALAIQEKYYGRGHKKTEEILEMLILSCAPVRCKMLLPIQDDSLFLHACAGEGDFHFVQFFIDRGGDVLKRDEHDTVLHQAVGGNSVDVVELIISKIKGRLCHSQELYLEAIDARDSDGDTPLMWAAEKGKTEILRILINSGANVNAKNIEGRTALDWALEGGHTTSAAELLV